MSTQASKNNDPILILWSINQSLGLVFQGFSVRSWRKLCAMSADLGTSWPLCWWSSVWISSGSGAWGRRASSGCPDRPTWSKSCRTPSTVEKNLLLIGECTGCLDFLSAFEWEADMFRFCTSVNTQVRLLAWIPLDILWKPKVFSILFFHQKNLYFLRDAL